MSNNALSRRSLMALGMAGLAATRVRAADEAYPQRPIRMLVGFPAGGFTDVMARVLAEPMGNALGQRIVVENIGGAAGTLAATQLATAPADGYTLLMGHTTANAAAPALMKSLRYDPLTAFAPITLAAAQAHAVLVRPDAGFKTIDDLLTRARNAPGKLTYASSGPGSVQHLAGELFKRLSGLDLTHVPYRGSAPALTDVIAGHVDVAFDGIGTAQSQLQSGALMPLAVTTLERSPRYPDLPTLDQAGLKGYRMASWFGLFAPAGTSAAIVNRLNAEAVKALATAPVRKVLDDAAATAGGNSPEAFAEFVRSETMRLGELIRAANITME
jgi:tripartite-type tricarboxylate transporter receptor subunit TctC